MSYGRALDAERCFKACIYVYICVCVFVAVFVARTTAVFQHFVKQILRICLSYRRLRGGRNYATKQQQLQQQ